MNEHEQRLQIAHDKILAAIKGLEPFEVHNVFLHMTPPNALEALASSWGVQAAGMRITAEKNPDHDLKKNGSLARANQLEKCAAELRALVVAK